MSDHSFLQDLSTGTRRAAHKVGPLWVVDSEVKQKIVDLIKASPVVDMPGGFRDKEALAPRMFEASDKVRIVPGGTSVRPGTYIGPSVVIMPPSFINIGAHIGKDTMIDSHVLVGSCAQIGERVHLSAGVQIGGVLEPIGTRPVIIEDDCFIGAGALVTEGVIVHEGAVIAPGVSLSAAVPIYDLINQKIYKQEIPKCAVVVSGTRPLSNNPWAKEHSLNMSCALIVKYRNDKTSAALMLEMALR